MKVHIVYCPDTSKSYPLRVALKPVRSGNTSFITVQSDRDIILAIYSNVAADWSKPTHSRLICISARLIVNGPPRHYVALSHLPQLKAAPFYKHQYATIEIDIIGSARYQWTTVLLLLTSLSEVQTRLRIAKIMRKVVRNDSFNCIYRKSTHRFYL